MHTIGHPILYLRHHRERVYFLRFPKQRSGLSGCPPYLWKFWVMHRGIWNLYIILWHSNWNLLGIFVTKIRAFSARLRFMWAPLPALYRFGSCKRSLVSFSWFNLLLVPHEKWTWSVFLLLLRKWFLLSTYTELGTFCGRTRYTNSILEMFTVPGYILQAKPLHHKQQSTYLSCPLFLFG